MCVWVPRRWQAEPVTSPAPPLPAPPPGPGPSRWRVMVGIVGLVLGVLATAFGAGIGLPYAAKTGLTVLTVIGLAALVAGVALLVVSGVILVRALPGWWRLAAVPFALGVLAFVVFPLSVALAVTHVPPTELSRQTPADRGLAYEDVRLATADGVELSGWYVPSRSGAAVVLRHGSGSTRSAVLDQAEVLAHHGYGVLLIDARGHGRSGGQAMDLGWYGERDTVAAVSWLAGHPGVDPGRIGAVGLSMGGEEVIGAAAADSRIRAVVAEGATNRTYADKGWLTDSYGARGWLQQRIDWVTYRFVDLLSGIGPPPSLRAAVARMSPRPVLLIAAGSVPDEGVADRWIQRASPDNVEVWEVPGADHTGGLTTQPAEWEQRVVAFLDRELAAPAA